MLEIVQVAAIAAILFLLAYLAKGKRNSLRQKMDKWLSKVRAAHPGLKITDVGDDTLAEHTASILYWRGASPKHYVLVVGGHSKVWAYIQQITSIDPSIQTKIIWRIADIDEVVVKKSNRRAGDLVANLVQPG